MLNIAFIQVSAPLQVEIPEVPEGKRLEKIEVKLEKQRIMQEDMFILMNRCVNEMSF